MHNLTNDFHLKMLRWPILNTMSMTSHITCFKCPDCESWHPDVIAVRQHMTRRHQRMLVQSKDELQSCLCSQSGPRRSFIPVHEAEKAVAPDNFRTQSLFAQRSLFGANVPSMDPVTMLTYFPPISGKGMIASIRKEVKEFLNWMEQQCCQEWSCDLRNRMAGHGFKPIQSSSHPKYVSVISAFCFFCHQVGFSSHINFGGATFFKEPIFSWTSRSQFLRYASKNELSQYYLCFKHFNFKACERGATSFKITNFFTWYK